MAGPSASVLVPTNPDNAQIEEVTSFVAAISSSREGDDFWVSDTRPIGGQYCGEERPFILGLELLTDAVESGEYEVSELDELQRVLGWRPLGAIGIAAMCNGKEDHRILAEICCCLAERFGGLVDFGAELGHVTKAEGASWGRFEVIDGIAYGDAAFLRRWMNHRFFHMVK